MPITIHNSVRVIYLFFLFFCLGCGRGERAVEATVGGHPQRREQREAAARQPPSETKI